MSSTRICRCFGNKIGRLVVAVLLYAFAGVFSSQVAAVTEPSISNGDRALSASALRAQVNKAVLEGRWLIDFQLLQKENVASDAENFIAQWQRNTAKRTQIVRLALSELQFANAMSLNREKGYRLLKQVRYRTDSERSRVAAIWVEHDTLRSRFSGAVGFENQIKRFLRGHPAVDLSVTAYKRRNEVFTRAFSSKSNCTDCERVTASTPFKLGEVSQGVAGILAARLEHRQQLQNGVPLNLSLDWKTRDLLILLPSHHQHRAVDLMSHTGCVRQQDNSAELLGVGKQAAASFYIEQVWNEPLIAGCAAGLLQRKSTLGFLYLAAFLEAATGRSSADLLAEELAHVFNLPSLAVAHGANPNGLGSGLEASSGDLGALLAAVLKGKVVAQRVVRNRLWKPASAHSTYSFGWTVGRNQRVSAKHTGLDEQAIVALDRQSGNILVALLRGKVSPDSFSALHDILFKSL